MNPATRLSEKFIDRVIDQSIDEDLGSGDITTNAVVDPELKAKAEWISKEEGVICGLLIAKKVFQKLDREIEWNPLKKDGEHVSSGEQIVTFNGNCRAILSAERTALNFAQRMSGIATQTHLGVKLLEGYKTQIVDTRKTVPGLRELDKYAVVSGGGKNHRMGLYDMAMVKDNHIVAAGGIIKAVKLIRERNPDVKIEVETTTLDQVAEAVEAGADIIMLDNMDTDKMRRCVKASAKLKPLEASGNITLDNVFEVAKTGVERISIGALTHSVKAFDLSMRFSRKEVRG